MRPSRLRRQLRLLQAWSTASFLIVACGAAMAMRQSTVQRFDELTVHRINIVEPDGTLRMVLADHARFPGVIVKGKEGAPSRSQAGILFYNDEGTENGGLISAGHTGSSGQLVDSGVALSFDKYGAGGQMVQLAGVSDNTNRFAGLRVNDNTPGGPNTGRVWIGNAADGSATLALMDQQGQRRIVMEVTADGTSSLTFLDAAGQVINRIVPPVGH